MFEHSPDTAAAYLNAPALSRLDIVIYLIKRFGKSITSGFKMMHRDWLIAFGRTIMAISSPLPPAISNFSSSKIGAVSSSSSFSASSYSGDDVAGAPSSEQQISLGLKTISIQFVLGSVEDIKERFLLPSSEVSGSEEPRPWPWLQMRDAAKTFEAAWIECRF